MDSMRVAILGASNKKERYSYKVLKQLISFGYQPLLVSPTGGKIEGLEVFKSLDKLKDVHTLTVYVNPVISSSLASQIIKLNPKRVIFNPGAENRELSDELMQNKITVENACTLVLLSTGQF